MNQPIELFRINENSWKNATRGFNKTIEDLHQDVVLLQKWLKTQPHLPDLLDSNCLRNFLILNKFSIEVTKQKIDNYYTMKIKFEEEYGKVNPKLPFNEQFCRTVYAVIYPELTSDLSRIGYYKIKNFNLMDSYEHFHLIKRLLMVQELRLRKDVMFSDIIVADFQGFPVALVAKFTPSLIYTTVLLYEKIYSNRIKAFYMINMPSAGAAVLLLVKKFMKPKMFSRIHVIEDVSVLKELIPVELLPSDFGGKGLSLDLLQEKLNKLLAEECKLFDNLDKINIDENLRPEKLENNNIMGYYGSFKKLDID